jgi:hypothetical protein
MHGHNGNPDISDEQNLHPANSEKEKGNGEVRLVKE